jgi:sarcosine oxidase delta subunit
LGDYDAGVMNVTMQCPLCEERLEMPVTSQGDAGATAVIDGGPVRAHLRDEHMGKGRDDVAAHQLRHAALCARWGRPQRADAAEALRLLGVSDVSPDDVTAFRYASADAAEAFAASNLENYGYRSLGIKVADDGVIGVTHVPWRSAESSQEDSRA